jgi:CarD family transcriptional regulator
MASVKKTMKSSETKKAKKPGIRTPKAKASKRFAVSKAQKKVTKPALAAKKVAAKKTAAKVAAKKVSVKLSAKTISAKTNAAKALAAKQLAAKKAAQKAKLKTKMAPAAPSRAAAAKNMNGNMTKKKTPAATRASASRSQTARGAKPAAARRGKPEPTRAIAAKRITATKQVEAVKHAAAPKTSARKVLRGKAAKAEVALRKPADSKTGAVQKLAAGKETAAALLAFKQNVARLTEARKRAAAALPLRPAVNASNNLSLEPSEPMTVTKEAKKVASMKTAPSADTKSTPPAATDTARETARKGAKGTAPMPPKASAKLLAPKAAPPVENRPVALAPVASDVSQVGMAEARPAEKAFAGAPKPAKAANPQRQLFKPGEFVVYPSHGVGQIVAIEEQEVAGFKLELYVISFIKDKMVLKVPTPKAASVGMRKLADATAVKMALDTLAGRARIKRTMWSRRAQEYEAKINSGDLNAIAEVVRDLYRSDTQPEQSYSERQLYEAALDRMTREIVVVQRLTETESLKVIEGQLQKGPRRGKAEDIDPEEADIEEAA